MLMLLGQLPKEKEEKCTQIACFLIQHNADPNAKNDDGLTPMNLCPSKKMKAAVQKFIDAKWGTFIMLKKLISWWNLKTWSWNQADC